MPLAILSSRLPCQCPFLNESASISNKSTVQASFLCKSQLSSLLSPSGSTVDMTVGCFSLANPISPKCTPGPLSYFRSSFTLVTVAFVIPFSLVILVNLLSCFNPVLIIFFYFIFVSFLFFFVFFLFFYFYIF